MLESSYELFSAVFVSKKAFAPRAVMPLLLLFFSFCFRFSFFVVIVCFMFPTLSLKLVFCLFCFFYIYKFIAIWCVTAKMGAGYIKDGVMSEEVIAIMIALVLCIV